MFPYSPEFLRELSPHGHPRVLSTCDTHRPDVSLRADNPMGPTTEDPTSSFQATQLSEHSNFIASNNCIDLYLSGFASITLMKGCVTINGYQLRIGSSETAYFPPWQPSCRVVCGDTYSHRKSKAESQQMLACFDRVFKGKGLEYGAASHEQRTHFRKLFNELSFIMIVDAIPVDGQEWLVAAEDQSGYPGLDTDRSYGPSTDSMTWNTLTQERLLLNPTNVPCIRRSSFMLGTVMRLRSLHFDCVTIPPSWETCTESFLKHVHHSMDNSTHFKSYPGNKLVVCGAKGVGKSTHTRYVLNRALSDRHLKAQRRMKRLSAALLANSSLAAASSSALALLGSVCYIDCDLGQPEMSTPGLVSLHVVSTPILAPPHLNIRTPERSFFLGDITSKSEPKLILECIALLYARYLEIRDGCIEKYVTLKKQQQTQELLSTNTYNALLLEEEEDGDNDGDNTDRRESINITSDILPLIVNTDGYIKSMGAEILSGILAIVQPTHIIHLCSERDHSILSPTLDDHISTATQEVCRVVLSPGRIVTAPQIAAVELRSLRLVSSFLRSNQELLKFTRTYYHANSQLRKVGGEEAIAAAVGSANDCIFIRSGSIVDSTGILAVHFLKSSAYSIPFSQLVISTMPKIEVPISLTLAAINASLIAFIKLEGSSSNDDYIWPGLCAPSPMRFRYDTKHLQQHHLSTNRFGHHYSEKDDSSIVEFELTVSSQCPLAECVGFGVVRFIDIPNSCLFITTPPNDFLHDMAKETSPSRLRICIVRGNLQLPTSMLYSPSLVCFPYFTSETAGEGATKSKNRHNLKRREHAA